MQVMIVEEDAILRTRIAGALAPEGVDVLSFGRLAPAKEAARRANVDILVLGESVEGRIASDVALLAEWRNPRLGSILLSDRDAEAAEELFDLIPSLQAVLARQTGPRSLARVAIATARSQEGIVLLHDHDAAAEHEGPVDEAPLAEEAAPTREWQAPAPVVAEFARPAAPGLAPADHDHGHEVTTLIREVLAQVETAPASELSAPPAPVPEPAAPLWPASLPEATPGRLYVLPNFLRDDEDEDESGAAEEDEADDDALADSLAASLPARTAMPMRRLNLA